MWFEGVAFAGYVLRGMLVGCDLSWVVGFGGVGDVREGSREVMTAGLAMTSSMEEGG